MRHIHAMAEDQSGRHRPRPWLGKLGKGVASRLFELLIYFAPGSNKTYFFIGYLHARQS